MKNKIINLMMVGLIATSFVGCGKSNTDTVNDIATKTSANPVIAVSTAVIDKEYTDRDKNASYDVNTATKINLSDENSVVTIDKEGTYILTGTLTNGQVVVNADENAKVQLVLNGVTIHSETSSPIYIKNADKVFITLADGTTNTLSDGTTYTQADGENNDGVIFSKADLTINGNGALVVNGNYKHGIVSKDDLVITGGNITITAQKKGLSGKDCIKIDGGTFNITSGGDAIHSSNDDDNTKGYVYISGGTFTISSGDDAIHSDVNVTIDGGTINITKSVEGIEAETVNINAGNINIVSSDDGINSTANDSNTSSKANVNITSSDENKMDIQQLKSGNMPKGEKPDWANGERPELPDGEMPQRGQRGERPELPDGEMPPTDMKGMRGGMMGSMDQNDGSSININGGYIVIDAGGDGIDTNGDLNITGGVILVNGPTNNGNSAVDYNGTANITGGTIIAVGSSGMAQNMSASSTQGSLLYNLQNAQNAGTRITLTDSYGNIVASFVPSKKYQSVVISTAGMTIGDKYAIYTGGTVGSADANGLATSGTLQGGTKVEEITLTR